MSHSCDTSMNIVATGVARPVPNAALWVTKCIAAWCNWPLRHADVAHLLPCNYQGCRRGAAKAARTQLDTPRRGFSEHAFGIDQLLLFLDNSRHPSQRPLTPGGSMEAHPRCRCRCLHGVRPSIVRVDQISVPPEMSPPGPGVSASGQWGHGETLPSGSRVTARVVAG